MDDVCKRLRGHERTVDVVEAVTRQGTEKGIHTVDCFDPSREVEMEDRLLDPDGILFNLVPILVHEHDDARQCSHEIV